MGKRSNFLRNERDFYPTPFEAVLPLLPHLDASDDWFIEPCAGNGALIDELGRHGFACASALDVAPQRDDIWRGDALTDEVPAGTVITNPPWDRKILHRLIERLSDRGKCWLLFDADWIHTKQAAPFMRRLRKFVSVGRVKWIEGSASTGKDNVAWYCFTTPSDEPTILVGRKAA